MRTATWHAAGAWAAYWTLATSLDLQYGFSNCVDNERTLFYYSTSDGTCFANSTGQVLAKPPVHGLRCDVRCGQGYFLGANFSGPVPVSGCERCPQGKYSLGGGALFSQRTNAWSLPLSAELQSDCVTRNMFTGRWEHNCNPWEPSADGSYISSGVNSRVMESFQGTRLFSTLRVSALFVRNGSVTYKYRVDAEAPYDGLLFQIDDDPGSELVSHSNGWKEAVMQVPAGAHTLVWNYMKDYSGDAGEDKAYLKVIELVGTAWSDLHCHSCGGDTTNGGGSLCAFCGPNEYAAAKSNSELDVTSNTCPPNTYAPKGSIGISSCVEQRPCSTDDVNETYTTCKDGVRNVTYAWMEPQTCNLTLQESNELPLPSEGVQCASCARGYKPAGGDQCIACAAGHAMISPGKCENCPLGTVVVNALEYGVGTPDAWNSWPDIFDAEQAQYAGWELSKSGVRFAQHTEDEEGAGFSSQPSRSALSFKVAFIHSGSLNLTYQLSGVPTFANDGSRAWVELEIRDVGDGLKKSKKDLNNLSSPHSDDNSGGGSRTEEVESFIHLLHGSENGTFNEIVPVNVTGLIQK
uniref:Tyrosine-protein kinase ephrin type A/B receptor-like domain-containing protein n=1 Tax=Peronospora matthiolae TaxID=2874970 RepID=A0AAV1UA44_9STRA